METLTDMNRKTVLPFLFAAILFASIGACTHLVRADSVDFISFPSGVTLFSPINRTYNSAHLNLNLTLYSVGSMGYIDSRISMNYSIDGKYYGPVPLVVSNPGVHVITNGAGLVGLPELPEGSHSLTLYLEGFNQKYYEPRFLSYVNTVYFAIDLAPPNMSILSPENTTYTTTSIPLNFTINEQTSNITYWLDGNKITMAAENTTLTGLSIGQHNITISAKDDAGNIGTSQTANFVITNPTPTPTQPPEPSPTIPIAAASAVLAAGSSLGILAYLKKHKP